MGITYRPSAIRSFGSSGVSAAVQQRLEQYRKNNIEGTSDKQLGKSDRRTQCQDNVFAGITIN
jgi:hypothetical protein